MSNPTDTPFHTSPRADLIVVRQGSRRSPVLVRGAASREQAEHVAYLTVTGAAPRVRSAWPARLAGGARRTLLVGAISTGAAVVLAYAAQAIYSL